MKIREIAEALKSEKSVLGSFARGLGATAAADALDAHKQARADMPGKVEPYQPAPDLSMPGSGVSKPKKKGKKGKAEPIDPNPTGAVQSLGNMMIPPKHRLVITHNGMTYYKTTSGDWYLWPNPAYPEAQQMSEEDAGKLDDLTANQVTSIKFEPVTAAKKNKSAQQPTTNPAPAASKPPPGGFKATVVDDNGEYVFKHADDNWYKADGTRINAYDKVEDLEQKFADAKANARARGKPPAVPAEKPVSVQTPLGGVLTKNPEDGKWYHEDGAVEVNPDNIAELEKRATVIRQTAQMNP